MKEQPPVPDPCWLAPGNLFDQDTIRRPTPTALRIKWETFYVSHTCRTLVRRGLLSNPRQVIRVAIRDGSRGDARHLIGVSVLRYGDDLCYPVTPGVQGDAPLGAFVDLAAPSIDGPDGSEVVRAGAQPLLDQLPAQVLEPARVGGRDDD
jgi:hypothetical protein